MYIVYQFFIFVVEFNYFFWIFVSRCYFFDQVFNVFFVCFQFVGMNDFVEQQIDNYMMFSLFFEQFVWQFQSLFFVIIKMLCSLMMQNVDFVVDQCSWYVDVVSFYQIFDCLRFNVVMYCVFQFVFYVFMYFSVQIGYGIIFNVEMFDEFFGQFWQFVFFNFFQVDNEFSCFIFQVFSMVFFWEGYIDSEFFVSFVVFNVVFKVWNYMILVYCQNKIGCFVVFEFFVVYRVGEVDGYVVFCISSVVFFFSGCLLFMQGVQYYINVSVGDFNNWFFNFDGFEVGQFNFWIDFKFDGVSEVFIYFVFVWNIVWCVCWVNFFFDDCVNEVVVYQIVQYVLVNRSVIMLSDDIYWYFVFMEVVNMYFFCYVDQFVFYSGFDVVSSDCNCYMVVKVLSGFN